MELQPVLNKIYEIRGYKVVLDFDLAEIYGIENKYLKRAVRNNIERFEGEEFMFELSQNEANMLKDNIRCKNSTLDQSWFRYPPFAFTELGVAMLSSVLNSKAAIETNRNIMRAFVFVRQLVLNARPTDRMAELERQMHELKRYIEESFADYNDINEDTRMQLELISEALAELQAQKRIAEKPRRPIGFRRNNISENEN